MEQHLTFIDQGMWTTDLCVGGHGGSPFLLCAQHPYTVKVIKFYRDFDCDECKIKGIYIENWDGTILKVGVFWDENPITFWFDENEKMTNVWLYSRKLKDNTYRFAGWKCHTDKGKDMECFAHNYYPVDSDKMEIPVGTGLFCGVFGKASADIDCFGLCMKKY